jgi:hypothetical protein
MTMSDLDKMTIKSKGTQSAHFWILDFRFMMGTLIFGELNFSKNARLLDRCHFVLAHILVGKKKSKFKLLEVQEGGDTPLSNLSRKVRLVFFWFFSDTFTWRVEVSRFFCAPA